MTAAPRTRFPTLDAGVTVEITGAGPSFSAGGDLDEFGAGIDIPALDIPTARAWGLIDALD